MPQIYFFPESSGFLEIQLNGFPCYWPGWSHITSSTLTTYQVEQNWFKPTKNLFGLLFRALIAGR